jgi:hypothetical protein
VDGQPDLLEVVLTSHACRDRADFLDSGEQESDENAYDGDYHKKLEQREASSSAHLSSSSL